MRGQGELDKGAAVDEHITEIGVNGAGEGVPYLGGTAGDAEGDGGLDESVGLIGDEINIETGAGAMRIGEGQVDRREEVGGDGELGGGYGGPENGGAGLL